MVLSCINTFEVILSDGRDTGAGPSENLEKWVPCPVVYIVYSIYQYISNSVIVELKELLVTTYVTIGLVKVVMVVKGKSKQANRKVQGLVGSPFIVYTVTHALRKKNGLSFIASSSCIFSSRSNCYG